MKPYVCTASKADVYDLIQLYGHAKFSDEQIEFFRKFVRSASTIWTGFAEEELVCMWGLIPPSLLADQAYLWLYVTDALECNEFTFVRQSQIEVKRMLNLYPALYGHVMHDNTRAIKWLRWLGAKFADPMGPLIPFVIRK